MDQLLSGGGSIAVVDAASGASLSHDELLGRVRERGRELSRLAGHVVLLGVDNDLRSLLDLLALTGIGSTVAVLDPNVDAATLREWQGAYAPSATIGFRHSPDSVAEGLTSQPARPERVLLATSGSTGSPKFVRLSAENLLANARQIVAALGIDPEQRALAHLPLFYSYGLSIVTSHLLAGSSIVLTGESAMQPGFWRAMQDHGVTTLPGVPYSYEMFRRAGLHRLELPHLRHLTQAGGRMPTERILELCASFADCDRKLWVMYGQTEATARMSVLPAGELPNSAGSVGYPVEDGTFEIVDPDDSGVGEIVFAGPNVMLGYAVRGSDVDGSDTQGGRLHTGDLGRLDAEGRLWIGGRLKRIAKVYGTRVSLDDVESGLARLAPLAVVEHGEGIRIFLAGPRTEVPRVRDLERDLRLPIRSLEVVVIDELPTTAAGKIDYQELKGR